MQKKFELTIKKSTSSENLDLKNGFELRLYRLFFKSEPLQFYAISVSLSFA